MPALGKSQPQTLIGFKTKSLELPFEYSSYPAFGYFDSVQTILFDECRQALYAVIAQNAPDLSQDMTLYLIISRNNGQSWSDRLKSRQPNSPIVASKQWHSMPLPAI